MLRSHQLRLQGKLTKACVGIKGHERARAPRWGRRFAPCQRMPTLPANKARYLLRVLLEHFDRVPELQVLYVVAHSLVRLLAEAA
jgi:hypothetical protein